MATEIKKQLTDLWGKEPIQFHHFEFVTQDQIDKVLNDIPKKYEKIRIKLKQTLAVIVLPKVERAITNGVEPNVWAKILRYKSSDNKRAKAIYEAVNVKYSRTKDWVSM